MVDLAAIRRKRQARVQLASPPVRRELRRLAGLSQQDVAEVLGVHRETVSRWERGERTPRGERLLAYATVLRVLREPAEVMDTPQP